MIKAITYEDIIKTLGTFLDTYSGLAPTRILNADSIRGTALSEVISSHEEYSPDVSSSFLLFELLENTDGDHFISKGKEEQIMMTVQSYIFHMMIYGNQAPKDAQKISAIFKEEGCALELRDSGVFIQGVSPVDPINEFINDTLLIRRDVIVKLQCRHEFGNVGKKDEYFDENQEITTITKVVSELT